MTHHEYEGVLMNVSDFCH